MSRDVNRILDWIEKNGPVSTLENYVIPGLRSVAYLKTDDNGAMLRSFEMTAHQEYYITPHNHRYNFECFVLDGEVENTIFNPIEATRATADHVIVPYDEAKHDIDLEKTEFVRAISSSRKHPEGDWYSMRHDQFHTITFAKGTRVLFLQGASVVKVSHCMLPYNAGRICNTFIWRDWMMTEK